MREAQVASGRSFLDPEQSSNGHRARPGSTEPRRRHLGRWFAAALVLALLADAGYVAARLNDSLQGAATDLENGSDALEDIDLDSARLRFTSAREKSASAGAAMGHPAFRLAAALPWIGNDAAVVRALARSGELAAGAGMAAVTGAARLGATEQGILHRLYRNGRVRLDSVRDAQPLVATVEAALAEGLDALEAAPSPTSSRLRAILGEARTRMSSAARSAHRSGVAMGVLPPLLGEGAPRRYFLAFQANGEARGTGGLIGRYGILEADDGRLRLVHTAPITDLDLLPKAVEAPRWFERRYEPLLGLRQWQQVNLSPHFPVVSQVLLRMYEANFGERLDGVVAMDPIALQELTRATGPLRAPGLDVEVGPDNAVDVLLHDSYEDFATPEAQDVYLAALIDEFWAKLRGPELDERVLVDALGAAMRSQHLKVYARDTEIQASLVELDAAGAFTSAGPNVQMLFHNNFSVNKVDYFLRRSMDVDIMLAAGGRATVTTTTTLTNEAPPGPPSLLLGSGLRGDPPGLNRMFLNLLLPQGARISGFELDGRRKRPYRANEDGYPVAWTILEIPPGDSVEMAVTYEWDGAIRDGSTFELTLWPHASVTHESYSLSIRGARGIEVGPGGAFDTSGTLTEPRTIRLGVRES